jgi:hypothetical protein
MVTLCKFSGEQTPTVSQAPDLPNTDFDTGHPTRLGEYSLADRTYGEWVRELDKNKFKNISPVMKQNILAFFADSSSKPLDLEEKEKENLEKTRQALVNLRALQL